MKLCALFIILVVMFLLIPSGLGEWNDILRINGYVEIINCEADNNIILDSGNDIIEESGRSDNSNSSLDITADGIAYNEVQVDEAVYGVNSDVVDVVATLDSSSDNPISEVNNSEVQVDEAVYGVDSY